MCEVSLHVPHRKAKATEKLIVERVPSVNHMRGLYEPSKKPRQMVCVRRGTKAVIKHVQFEAGLPSKVDLTWHGKKNVEVTLSRRVYHDAVTFPDGSVVFLNNFKIGTKFWIGVPTKKRVTKPKTAAGMKAVEKAIDEAVKTPVPRGWDKVKAD